MTNENNAAQAANENPLSDEYVNAIIQRHGYDSPESVIAQLHQWIGLHGGEDTVTLLMYEAHKALSKLRAPVADERAAFEEWRRKELDPTFVGYTRDELTLARAAWDERARRAAQASAPVAGEAVYTLRVRGAIQAWTPTAAAFSIPDGEHQLFLSPAAPQASAEDELKSAINKFMDTAIKALAAIVNVHTPDEIDALDAMPREPVIDQVRRLSQACEELSRQVRPGRPQAANDGARCACPSGDGSPRHPCPAHPQTNAGQA